MYDNFHNKLKNVINFQVHWMAYAAGVQRPVSEYIHNIILAQLNIVSVFQYFYILARLLLLLHISFFFCVREAPSFAYS